MRLSGGMDHYATLSEPFESLAFQNCTQSNTLSITSCHTPTSIGSVKNSCSFQYFQGLAGNQLKPGRTMSHIRLVWINFFRSTSKKKKNEMSFLIVYKLKLVYVEAHS